MFRVPVSVPFPFGPACPPPCYYRALRSVASSATKCVSKNHGYDKTLLGVDESLKNFGFGMYVRAKDFCASQRAHRLHRPIPHP